MGPPTVRFVSVAGAGSLATSDYGAGTATTCLLLHGNGLNARAYDPLARLLSAAGLRVVSIDLRGHGLLAGCTHDADTDLRWPRLASDALEVLHALGLADSKCVGFGHSLGGACLLLAEAQRPGTFSALYVFEPVVCPEKEVDAWLSALDVGAAAAALHRRPDFPSLEAAFSAFRSKPPFNAVREACLRAYM